jgi:hypothetical protein
VGGWYGALVGGEQNVRAGGLNFLRHRYSGSDVSVYQGIFLPIRESDPYDPLRLGGEGPSPM